MNKNGSLELSVNAIVVLILAITMLGLGLGFMKGMFGKVSQNVDTAIGQNQLANPPSASNPFTLSSNQISLARGAAQTITLAYYNELTSGQVTAPNINNAYLADGVAFLKPNALAKRNVTVGNIGTWQILVEANKSKASGSTTSIGFNISGRYADLIVQIK